MSRDLLPPSSNEALFSALSEEFARQDWNQPVQSNVAELGLALHSHVGLKRGRNEDRIAVARVCAENSETYTLALVCDGVGGSQSGDKAATLAVTSMISELCAQRVHASVEAIAQHLLRTADNHVRYLLNGSGTTTASLFIAASSGQCAAANVGDSRIYSWKLSKQLNQVSLDDTVENELKLFPGDHEELLNARGLRGRLSQAIGEEGRSADDLRIRVFSREKFPAGVLLGSDGLWKTSKDFEVVIKNSANANDAARRAIALANWTGGVDNVSVIAIESVEKFCELSSLQAAQAGFITATVWLGQSTLKFIMERFAPFSQQKQEKPRRRAINKRKVSAAAEREQQLSLTEAREANDQGRPVIEISVGKKSE